MAINGAGRRKSISWIDDFVEHSDNLQTPAIFRKWAAIGLIGSVLEQKVWLDTGSRLHPNLYVLLIGHPGTGKTKTIRRAKGYALEIADFHLAPTSMTAASLVDALVIAKRMIVRLPEEPLEYNSMLIAADELGTFIHKYDDEMIAVLSAFFDPDPYGHTRRGGDIKIKIKSPQLSILAGSTPSNLLNFMPENAWDQGFTSRLLLVFSDERIIGDDFATVTRPLSLDLIHDLKIINTLCGQFFVTEDYRTCINNWRALGEPPTPSHPKLLHYNTRRRFHLHKLAMVAAVSKSNELLLTKEDFNQAMNWLVEAEAYMPEIFKAGATGGDARAMEEIKNFVMVSDMGKGVSEHRIIHFACERIPAHSVERVIKLMEQAGMIEAKFIDRRSGNRSWVAKPSP